MSKWLKTKPLLSFVHRAFYLCRECNLSHCNKALAFVHAPKILNSIFFINKKIRNFFNFYFGSGNGTRHTSHYNILMERRKNALHELAI